MLRLLTILLMGSIATAYERPALDYSRPDPVVFQVPEDAVELLAERPSDALGAIVLALGVDAPDESTLVKRLHDWTVGVLRYDDQAPAEDLNRPGVLDEALRDRQTVCAGYALLLDALCRQAGLECRIVHGYGRGDRNRGAEDVEAVRSINHAWNAVRCDGVWRLIDATWNDGSGGAYRTDWLFTDPALFVRSHLPTEARWQLLDDPLDAAGFAASIPLSPTPFVLAHLADLPDGVTPLEAGISTVTLPDPGRGHYYLARLRRPDGSEEHDDRHLAQGLPDGRQRLRLYHPGPGDWQLTVFHVPVPPPGAAGGFRRNLANCDLFTLPLRADAAATAPPPIRYAAFYALGCTLIGPVDDSLRPGQRVVFAIDCPVDAQLLIADNGRLETLSRDRQGRTRLLWTVQRGGDAVHLVQRLDATRLTTLVSWRKTVD